MRARSLLYLARRILANKVRRKLGHPVVPYKLIWNTTYYCNSRCTTCNIWQIYPSNGGSQNDELNESEVSRAISSLGSNLVWLTMTGGEPTLKRHMADAVKSVYDACPRLALITVNTNAIVPKPVLKTMEAIASHCERAEIHAMLSLDGVGPIHDKVRGVPGNFDSLMEVHRGLTKLKERLPNLRVGFQSTVNSQNLAHLDELVTFCEQYGDEHSITFAQEAALYHNHGDGHDVTADQSSLLPTLKKLMARYRVRHPSDLLEWAHLRIMRHFITKRAVPISCTAGASTITLGPTGDVTGCLFLDNRIGNVKDYGYDLMSMVRTARAAAVRDACSDCHECWTNCESFPSMMDSPLKTMVHALRPSASFADTPRPSHDAPTLVPLTPSPLQVSHLPFSNTSSEAIIPSQVLHQARADVPDAC